MERTYGDYTSKESQNDLITVFGNKIVKTIVEEVKEAKFFALLVDETKDLSKKEQLAVLLRYVHSGVIKEHALGAFRMQDLSADSLYTFIVDKLTEFGIDMQFCIGQCYNGASVIRGSVNRVQAKIKEKVPHAAYTHCYAHRLNLVLVNTIRNIPELSDFFYVLQTLYTFIANSNTRHGMFIEAQKHLGQKVLQLERTCITRWLYWYRAVQKLALRYEAVMAVLDAAAAAHKDGSVEAAGLNAKLESYIFIVNLHIVEKVLAITFGLSEQLQSCLVVLKPGL